MVDELETDEPDRIGYSLANMGEVLLACLDAAEVRSVVEIGADRGLLTEMLLVSGAGGRTVTAVDPDPPARLESLKRLQPELILLRELSHEALRRIELPDAIVIDGDHNYYTVSQDLEIIGERAPESELPLLLFHDVRWPHARRDSYYAPERIPEQHRQPLAPPDAEILPGEAGVVEHGLPMSCAAAREGGERNGVLTAIEHFVASREGLALAAIPAFFGFGVLWHREASWAGRLEAVVAPLDANPLLERLELNRVEHLAGRLGAHRMLESYHNELARITAERDSLAIRAARQEELLRRMLDSGAFALGERVSALRQRGKPLFSRDDIKRAIDG